MPGRILAELQVHSPAFAASFDSPIALRKSYVLQSLNAESSVSVGLAPTAHVFEASLPGVSQLNEEQLTISVPEPVGSPEPWIPTISPSPLIPVFPNPSPPMLSGHCPVDFSVVAEIIDRTAQDCPAPLAAYVGNVICCPQFESLICILQGQHGLAAGQLTFNVTEAEYCSKDILSLLVSEGANSSILNICSFQTANLTGGSCPVKDNTEFAQLVNTTKLLAACKAVDPLKECCDPVCKPALIQAATQLATKSPPIVVAHSEMIEASRSQVLDDCMDVVLAWLAGQLSPTSANTALRNLLSCKVNEECPLIFNNPSSVIQACGGQSPSVKTCCTELHKYISDIQQQTFITDLQALHCVTLLGLMLKKGAVTANVYELCSIDLKDFSLQGNSDQGCLLNSLPTDVMSNRSGISFTCDLNNNIPAPWPPTSTPALCSRNTSVPTIPQKLPSAFTGPREIGAFVFIITGLVVVYLTDFFDAICK
ncbi:hypothetical protein O6H91_Y446800 [Diphasiastrum complanatum]|nr:hypothetical protein O6H91_Y446800 [Diphasiastrum complanatum]KAJ7236560.1 hypothetical protein O6H91_Y446800 [Diphasiastrum complanatum]